MSSQNIHADLKGSKIKYKLHYGWCTGRRFRSLHCTTPAAVNVNKNKKMSSFKSNKNVHKKEDGSLNVFQNNGRSLLFPSAMLISCRVLCCAKTWEKINVCCFLPFKRQWRGYCLNRRNRQERKWKKCPKNTPKLKNWFLELKVGIGKRKRKYVIFACLAEMSKTFTLQFYCEGVRIQRWLIIIFLKIWFTQSRDKIRLPENYFDVKT